MPHYHAPHSRRKLRRLNARQRKKYHLAEFQNFTFYLQGALEPEFQTTEYFDEFLDEVICFIEKKIKFVRSVVVKQQIFHLCLTTPKIRHTTSHQRNAKC